MACENPSLDRKQPTFLLPRLQKKTPAKPTLTLLQCDDEGNLATARMALRISDKESCHVAAMP